VEQIIEPAIGVRDGVAYRKGPAWKRHFAKGPECENSDRVGGRGDRRVSNAVGDQGRLRTAFDASFHPPD
jgi:hypothetical protein